MSSISFNPNSSFGLPSSMLADAPAAPVAAQPASDVDTLTNGPSFASVTGAAPSALAVNGGDVDGSGAAVDAEYTAWQDQLAILANDDPNPATMLALAEAHGIPVQTAVQDIVDALGIAAAAENNGFLEDRIADLLVNSDAMPREQLAGQLSSLSFMANRGDFLIGPYAGNRIATVERGYMQALQAATWGRTYDPAAVEALRAKYETDIAQARALDVLEGAVRNSARSYGAVSSAEAAGIVDQCVATAGHGEQQGYVSAAEIQAIVAGVARKPESDRAAALAMVAREMLAREAQGTLVIDPAFLTAVRGAAGG